MKNGVYVFNVVVSEKLMFHCCFIDDFLMRYWWKMEVSMQTLLISKDLLVLIFFFLEPSLLLDSLFVDESLNKLRWDIDDFEGNSIKKPSFKRANVQNIKVLLVLFWWLFYDSSKKHCWKSKVFDANIHDHKLFFLLFSETLIFLCCFSDDSLIIRDDLMMEEQKNW